MSRRVRHTRLPRSRMPGGVTAATAIATHVARSSILAAATKVFTAHGIAAVRVEDILVAAKIARRTFYKYFASKDEVLAALYEIWTDELLHAIEDARARQPSVPLAGLRAGIDIFVAFFHSVPHALRELVEIAMRSDSLLAPRRRWLRAQIVQLLDDGVFALDGRRLDPLVYYGLVSALEGISLELGGHDGKPSDVERARRVLHSLVDHVLGLPGPTALPQRSR